MAAKKISDLTALTAVDKADRLEINDVTDATADKSTTVEELLEAINTLTAETSIADSDIVLIYDASASAIRKMTKANLVAGLIASASNHGDSGVGVYYQEASGDLEFRKIAGVGEVSVGFAELPNKDIEISVDLSAQATLTGAETLTNKTLTSPTITDPTLTALDSKLTVQDNGDPTKQFKFQASGITAGQTRTLTVPDVDINLGAVEIGVAVSDETTDLTTGTAKITFRMPYAMTLTGVRASVNTAPTGANLVVDINEGGTTILSTKLSIDATEKTSTTAATPAVISDASLADDSEITIDIDAVGSTIPGKGLKIWLIGVRA